MDLVSEVLSSVRRNLHPEDGACGICHITLRELSLFGGKAISYELPDGVASKILDDQGKIIGEGIDIVWAPSILKAQIEAGLIPEPFARNLSKILIKRKERKLISSMFGYGRCVTPAGLAMSIIWQDGGSIEVQREGLAILATLYDSDGSLISEAAATFCPVCAINLSVSRNDELKEKITEALKDANNTGRLKYDRNIENIVQWKKRRVFTHIQENDKIIGTNWGCCIAYATVRAEIAAGFGSRKWNHLFKNYCDMCPLKHCWMDKSMGAVGNIILHRMKHVGLKEKVKMNDYITALICDNNRQVGRGIGSLCSLSATVNAFLRADAVKILKPSPAEGFPYK
ncbi:MAG: hypothetical protein FJ150_06070 [Euryarchaeota archaeon]|nr:hypothetical protein [Euryarchaeota archaeon]